VIYLWRDEQAKGHISSVLLTPQGEFYVLERPWLGNRRNISCIPPGRYRVRYLKRSVSGKYRNVYHVLGVPGRSGILIHNGNTVDHSRGCLLVGKRRGFIGGKRAVLNSRSAMRALVRALGKRDFELTIIG
jgi:hypothetical protein